MYTHINILKIKIFIVKLIYNNNYYYMVYLFGINYICTLFFYYVLLFCSYVYILAVQNNKKIIYQLLCFHLKGAHWLMWTHIIYIIVKIN